MAILQLDWILVERTATKITKALQLLPSKLEDTYKEPLLRIQSQAEPDNSLGMRVLMWTSKSKRPLHAYELRHALVVEWYGHENPPRNLDHGHLLGPEDLIGVCTGIVMIETESKVIRLVHFTIEEFFCSSPELLFPDAGIQISKTCLAYLSFGTFRKDSYSAEEMRARVQHYPLFRYAADWWSHHYRERHDLKTENMALVFLQSYCNFAAPSNKKNLHSSHGLPRLVAKLLKHGAKVDQIDERGWAPLARAVEGGHESVVRLLLETAQKQTRSLSRYR
jgi:hypothetical protein